LIGRRIVYSTTLLAGVMLITVPTALALGLLLALRRDGGLDRLTLTGLIVLKAVPGFAIGIGVIMLLSTSVFRLLPAVSLINPDEPMVGQLEYLVLPTLALVLSSLPYLVRLVRASMIEVLESEYITQARLRGIPESRILWRHALPNALIPAIYAIAMMLNMLLGGAVLMEVVFTYPGLGSALNAAVETRDLPMIQAIILVVTAGVVVVNLTADLLVVLLTPRLRTTRRAKSISRGLRARRRSTRLGGLRMARAPRDPGT
jgi:peptide/nickel transport system permease protein